MQQRDTRDYSAPREYTTTPSAGDLNCAEASWPASAANPMAAMRTAAARAASFRMAGMSIVPDAGVIRRCLDETFTGEISTNDLLMVGDGAKVTAEISCGTVIVEGEVIGNIKATSAVELRRPAKVHGDITTPSLVIEKGVVFEGRSRMDELQSSNVVPIYASAEPGE